jgi:LCP family protein required for cell wall assembly
MEGFVVRRQAPSQRPQLGAAPGSKPTAPHSSGHDFFAGDPESGSVELPRPLGVAGAAPVHRSDLSESLQALDHKPPSTLKKRPGRLRRMLHPTKKKVIILFVLLILGVGGFFAYKVFANTSRLFSGNVFDLLGKGAVLKEDANGRTNVLIFGTSEDDPSHRDAGANLTDSIMLVSLDQDAKNAVMISVPRDLWVKYGEGCMSGYEGKINVVYECGSDDGKDEPAGAKKLMGIVGDVYGVDIQYYSHVNYKVVRDTVNAVGGVTVQIDSDDPRGVLDRNFDWMCRYKCNYVKWPNGPANLNGDQALALARARNASGGYGLGGGNFDREQYQQKILIAIKDKASSAGTLANPVAVTNLLDALGDNVRTNFSSSEVKSLINLARDLPSSSIKRVSLVDGGKAVLTTGNVSGQSVVRPVAGLYNFDDVRSYVAGKLTTSTASTTQPTIEVLNGSDYGGLAGSKAAELKAAGFAEVSTGDTPTSASYRDFVWYDLSGGKKPESMSKLQSVLGTAPSGTVLPSGVTSDADFVIIVGNESY